MAWSLVSVLFFIFVATVVGWTSLGYSMGFNLALAAEAVLMSLPLAYRIRQLKLEREASAMAARTKSLFLARMSHEIRTPMTAIMGFTDISLKASSLGQVRPCLLKVKTAASHLLGLINEILDLAKIEAGRLDVERKPFNLTGLVREVCDIVAPTAGKNRNELLLDMDEAMPVRVLGDPMRLKQILVNLAGNAVKFTQNGDVWIKARLCVEKKSLVPPSGRKTFRFEVSDTGPGIPPEQLPRLFEPFEQGGGDTASRFGGTGLGLNICSRLVNLMGGRIGVFSEPGRGSTFWFELEMEPDASPCSVRMDTYSDLTGLCVLVADDHSASRGNLALILASLGFACEAVDSGSRAVEAVSRDPGRFALVILDWDMPGLDGLETLVRLRAAGLSEQTPVLLAALSSHAAPEGREFVEIGAAGLLTKPVTADGVLHAVLCALGHRGEQFSEEVFGAPEALHNLKGMRVLLVDDNIFNQEVACTILEQAEATTEVACNGQEALWRLEEAEQPYDAVLMDMTMPVMDGLEASRRIRAMEKFRDLPIIAMTANAMQGDREACLAAGMNDHLAKPIDTGELCAALRRWISHDKSLRLSGLPAQGAS
jgi:two-component system, sensor histidine kinase and response regulator